MQRSVMESLLGAFEAAATQLRAALGDKPPTHLRVGLNLIPYMPESLDELPEWLDRLTDDQFRLMWVAAVVSCIAEANVSDESDRGDARTLAAVMICVRDRYAKIASAAAAPPPSSLIKPNPSGATDGPSSVLDESATKIWSVPEQRRQRTTRPKVDWKGMLDRARALAPNPGDCFVVAREFPADIVQDLRAKLTAFGEFELQKSDQHKSQRGHPMYIAVRRVVRDPVLNGVHERSPA